MVGLAASHFPEKGFFPIMCQGLTNEMEGRQTGEGGREGSGGGEKANSGEQRRCLYLRGPVDV